MKTNGTANTTERIAEMDKDESLKNYCEHCEGHTDEDKCADHCVFKNYKEEKKDGQLVTN